MFRFHANKIHGTGGRLGMEIHDRSMGDCEQPEHSNVSPTPRDPIEPDPMNPVPVPADTEPKSTERPDLDWAEHED
jgi:hypothetical protein